MAEHRIGRTYVEVDMDYTPYTRAQKRLYKDATQVSLNIEKNFKNLGIRSAKEFDLMRAKVTNSYNMIAKSGKATANDLVRAEKAKAEQIRRINEQQYGHTVSMFEKIKKNWLTVTATIVAASYAIRTLTNITMDTIRVASDLQEVSSKFNVVFKGQEAAAISWSKTLVDLYAMSTRESKQYLSSVQDLLVPMGMQAEAAGKMSFEIVKLSADLGSFNNLPTEKVMLDIQSALVGNFETMKKYGVILNETVIKQAALNAGLWDGKGMVDANTKAQMAYKLMLAGSAAAVGDMARTSGDYANQVKQLHANIEDFKALLGNELLPVATEVVSIMNDWVRANKDLIKQNLEDTVDKITISIKGIVAIYNSLPDGVIGAAGYGIVGRLLTGSTPIGTAVALIALLNAQLATLNMNLGAMSEKGAEFNKAFGNIWDVLTGKRDWNTGELKDINEQFKEMAGNWEMVVTQFGSGWVKKEDLDDFLNWLKKTNEETKDLGDDSRKAFALAQAAMDKANKSLKEYYKELDKAKAIMDPISLAAFPKFERGVENIIDKYDKWNVAIEKNAEKAGYTTEEIALLYTNLGLRMDEEIKDYVESHEKGNEETYDLWQHTYEKMTDILADFYETGKFNLKDFVDFFKRQLAQMAAAWTMGNQTSGGFSFANMFGGMFGGGALGVPQSGGANFSPVQAGVHGASSAYSLSQAYGAYTTAGGGWAGMKAGAGSFFGGGSIMPYVVAAVVAYDTISSGLSSAKEARKSPFASSWERGDISQIFNESIMRLSYPAMGEAINKISSLIGIKFLNFLGPLGSIAGGLGFDPFGMGKMFNKLFGNKKRAKLGRTYEYDEYSPETGWGASEMIDEYKEKRRGYKFRESADAMAQTGLDLMNALDSMFKNLLGAFGENWTSKFSTEMIGLAAGKPSFDFYISAEKKSEFREDWAKSWQDLTKNLIDPIVDIGSDLLSQALEGTVTDATAWNYFTDEMREYLATSLENSLADLKVDWSTVTNQESFEAAVEQMGLAAEEIASILDYFGTVGAILEHITTIIDMHDFSDSVKGAVSELKSIESEFLTLESTLESLGVDLEKYTDLQIAYNMAIEDWINKAFVGAFSYASTSQGWQAMAPQGMSSTDVWIGQYQHVQDLYNAYDGTTASAIELSDALGILSGLSYDIAAEIQGAINSIHQSYTSALESMYLETLSGQGKYDYYRTKIEELYSELPSLTSVAAIQQYMDDILRYSTAAYGMMDEDQKQQYYAQYEAFLRNVEAEGTSRLEEIGNAMNDVNDDLITKLTPLIVNMITDIQDAAILQVGAANTQVIAAGLQLDAAGTPISIDVNIASSEVG